MSTIPLILSVCTSLNALAAASRQAWSLARDQALPFSSWFRKVCLGNNRTISCDTDIVPGHNHWHSHPTQFDHVLPFDPYYYRLDQHRRKFTISAALSTNQYD
jgi:hypothetical protein